MLAQRIARWLVIAVIVALAVPALPHAAAAGGSIAYGQTVQGTINNSNYFELWQFSGTKGDRVQILMEGDGILDPYLGLIIASTEEVLAEDDDSGGNGNAYLDLTLPSTDSYIIVATRYNFDTGTSAGRYTLSLVGSGGPVNVSTTTTTTTTGPQEVSPGIFFMGDLALAEPVTGTIDSSAYAHLYSLQLEAGTDLIVAMFAGEQSTLDPYLGFGTEDGDVLAEDDDSGPQVDGGQYDSFVRLTIPQTGSYLVLATRAGLENGTSSGDYVLVAGIPDETVGVQEQTTEELPPGMTYMGAIGAGATMKGTITADSYFHIYDYEATANEQITITMIGTGGLDSYLGILDPNDEVIAEDDDSAGGLDAQISIRLPESGTYLIVATRNGMDEGTTTGPYSLTLTPGTPPAPAGTTSTVGGFGGLPGRAFSSDGGVFYLRGFGESASAEKCSALGKVAGVCAVNVIPGRAGYMPLRSSRIVINLEEMQ